MKKVHFLAGLLALTLVGCSGKADHAPRTGEYGKVLTKNDVLSSERVQELSTSEIKPFLQATSETMAGIDFIGNSADNPYRFVMVIKGRAINKGKVDVGMMYGASVVGEGFSPKIMKDEYDSTYDAGEQVLLVVTSNPFSVAKNNDGADHYATATLSTRDNIAFDSVELQIWQGKGSKYSSTWIASFSLLLIAALILAYRIARRV